MRPIRLPILLLLAAGAATQAQADNCADLATRFSGGERFHMTLGELDELKTCINVILREKISSSSTAARGATSPEVTDAPATQALRPRSIPILQDAE
ncbi:MAG: hypothetical protein K0R03_780 [Moraxellaceae bacterium]|nr:hypothetical protein [Moraxellaceae bacterium]MDF3030222.1 hypothetical protein [Moraxellaceae bacterium]